MLCLRKDGDIIVIYEGNRYYEFINEGYIRPAPLTVIKDGMQISYPSDEIYEELGYKLKIADNVPEIGENEYIQTYYENTSYAIYEHYRVMR